MRMNDNKDAIRKRSEVDTRDMYAVITDKGMALREKAAAIPTKIETCVPLESEKAVILYQILHEMMEKL